MITPGSVNPLLLDTEIVGEPKGRSIRLRNSAASLTRSMLLTPTKASAFTLSMWFKLGTNTSGRTLAYARSGTGPFFIISVGTDDLLEVAQSNGGSYIAQYKPTTKINRGRWYHLVVAVNLDDATASERLVIYLDGVRQTSFAAGYALAPGLGGAYSWAYTGVPTHIGGDGTMPVDSYFADIYSIDGFALGAYFFGKTVNGKWVPKKYLGAYGNNGFHIDFADMYSSLSPVVTEFTTPGAASYTIPEYGNGTVVIEAWGGGGAGGHSGSDGVAGGKGGDTTVQGLTAGGGLGGISGSGSNGPGGGGGTATGGDVNTAGNGGKAAGTYPPGGGGGGYSGGCGGGSPNGGIDQIYNTSVGASGVSGFAPGGGGAGGGGTSGGTGGGGGGGGGSYVKKTYTKATLPTGTVINGVVGAGGAHVVAGNSYGGNGAAGKIKITVYATSVVAGPPSSNDVGRDSSGNNNHFTASGVDANAPGTQATYDVMDDGPAIAFGNEIVVNRAIIKQAYITISDGALTWTNGPSWLNNRATIQPPEKGKYYFEAVFNTAVSGGTVEYVGLCTPGMANTASGADILNAQNKTTGDIIGFAIDRVTNIAQSFRNGVLEGSANIPATGPIDIVIGCYNSSGHINFGQQPFLKTPPAGFSKLNDW